MRSRGSRALLVALGSLALLTTSCQSNNQGKIEGTKWVGTHIPNMPPSAKIVMEFEEDGELLLKIYTPHGEKRIKGKYRLLWGDNVQMYDLSEPIAGRRSHREKIIIAHGELTMIDSDGTTAVFREV